jgi:cytoskeleton protein RodZ
MEELESELLLDDVEVDAMTLPEAIAKQTEALPADLLAPEPEAPAADPLATEAAADASVAPQETTPVADAQTELAAPVEEPATAEGRGLQLSVAADCWVQVSAVDGRVLHSGLLRDGQALNIDHDGALNLVIGDRSAVTTIRFQGNPVTLPPQSQSGVVRLRLGE